MRNKKFQQQRLRDIIHPCCCRLAASPSQIITLETAPTRTFCGRLPYRSLPTQWIVFSELCTTHLDVFRHSRQSHFHRWSDTILYSAPHFEYLECYMSMSMLYSQSCISYVSLRSLDNWKSTDVKKQLTSLCKA